MNYKIYLLLLIYLTANILSFTIENGTNISRNFKTNSKMQQKRYMIIEKACNAIIKPLDLEIIRQFKR